MVKLRNVFLRSPAGVHAHGAEVRKTGFLSHLYIKVIFLPRQAWDKHRERRSKKTTVLCTSAWGDHTNINNPQTDPVYLDFAPLFALLQGKRWVLEANAVATNQSDCWTNVFTNIRGEVIIPSFSLCLSRACLGKMIVFIHSFDCSRRFS